MDDDETGAPDDASGRPELDEVGGITPTRWRLRLLVVAVGAVVLVVVAILGVSQAQQASDAQDELDRVLHARETAAAFGAAYLTYDAKNVDASSRRLLALTTEAFGAEFEKTRTPGIEALFDQIGTSTKATTTEVFVSEISGDEASALVVVDVKASSAETPEQTLVNLTFVLDLVLEDGEWKVDAVNPAPRPEVVGGPTSPASTSTVPEHGSTPAPEPPTTGSGG